MKTISEEGAPSPFACKCGRIASYPQFITANGPAGYISQLPALLEAICAACAVQEVVSFRGELWQGDILWTIMNKRDVEGGEVPAS